MNRNSRFRVALLSLLTIVPALAQQPKFEMADVHVSTTARGFAQNFGGVLRDGTYVNRDATMLDLIEAAYGVSEDSDRRRSRLAEFRPVRRDRQSSRRHDAGDRESHAAGPAGGPLQAGDP